MGLAYNPSNRANDFQVKYYVKTTGDRWFIPVNNEGTTAEQVAQCDIMCGDTADGSACGAEAVAV